MIVIFPVRLRPRGVGPWDLLAAPLAFRVTALLTSLATVTLLGIPLRALLRRSVPGSKRA